MKNKIRLLFISLLALSCDSGHNKLTYEAYGALTDEEKRDSKYALEGMDLLDSELEVTLFASEPMMRNPTNMDIDARGRVWIVEGYNYRNSLNPRNSYEPKGDRILILEDTTGDGKADKSTVFYQGEDINSALGIGVFGNKVIVSRSPYVFIFTDEDGDDVPDKKEILFEGIGGEDHDHGMHAFTFGPDGKFYFNYGNAGESLLDKEGKPVLDNWGTPINSDAKPYRQGMVFRSDLNGNDVEVLAWNFRNNFEVTVDSYGRLWQSDNDDDGNKAVRINYVMDYGNYGFQDEMTGAGWRSRRVGMSDSIPLKHWHLNDPGVVPNLLQTGAGSPTGILLYEGKLLPEKYQNQIIHADAGPNVVRSYPVKKDGAGFSATVAGILDGGSRDRWFRPSDVTTAPDGSVFVTDWYDTGVGGHAMGDNEKGRIYRIAPKNHAYAITKPNFQSIAGNIEALQSPNIATRYVAWTNLHDKGLEAEAALVELWGNGDSRMRARAFWLLSKLPEKGKEYILEAAEDSDENIRLTAIRAARELNYDFSELYLAMAADESSPVRREVAFAIRHIEVPEVWQKLADRYEDNDRWYLEALGIAAEGFWDTYLPSYLEQIGNDWLNDSAARDIVWRSRSTQTLDLLGQLIASESVSEEKVRYYRAMDFQTHGDRNSILLSLLEAAKSEAERVLIFKQLTLDDLDDYPKLKAEIGSYLASMSPEDFLDVVRKFEIKDQKNLLLHIVKNGPRTTPSEAARTFIDFYGIAEAEALCYAPNDSVALSAIERFGLVDNKSMTDILIGIFQNEDLPIERRQTAMMAMNGYNSETILWNMVQNGSVPEAVMDIAKQHLLGSWVPGLRTNAAEFFNENENTLIDASTLLSQTGDKEKGKVVFDLYCQSCHLVNGSGIDFGPGLSQIGGKLSKEGLFNAILNPSEGMGFGYETQLVKLKDGSEIQVLITSKTESELSVKLMGQSELTVYSLDDVLSTEQLETSIMPKFPLEEEQLVDLVAYLESLK